MGIGKGAQTQSETCRSVTFVLSGYIDPFGKVKVDNPKGINEIAKKAVANKFDAETTIEKEWSPNKPGKVKIENFDIPEGKGFIKLEAYGFERQFDIV